MGRLVVHWGVLAAIILALGASSCSPHKDTGDAKPRDEAYDPGSPVQGDWIIQRIDSDIDTLNPVTLQTDNAQWLGLQAINEGLLHLNGFTLKLDPCLAESWEISADKLSYTFHLRHGVKFHDGEPFTAEDVKFTFDKVMDPKVDAAPLRSYLNTVKACDVLDDYTIRFVTTEPYFKMLEVLGTYLAIVPKHYFDKGDTDFNRNRFGRHPIGTGPYKFVRWDTGSQIVIERNDNYWAGANHYPKRIVFQILEETYVAAQLLKRGEIDVFNRVSPLQWERELKGTRSMNHLRQLVYSYPAYTYLGFNLRLPMFSDIRVRHAIDLLMPRQELLHQVYLDHYATLATGYDPPADRNYNHEVKPTPEDPEQAKQLLTEAGWKNDHGDGLLYKDGHALSITLLYPSGNSITDKIAELMQESLAKAGIELKLSRLQFAQLIERVNDWKFDAMLGSWGTDINGDPSQLWSGAEADVKKSSNFIGYKNAAVDKLIAEGRLEYDDDKRAALFRQVHQLIHDDYPVCFLFNPALIMVTSSRLQDVKTYAPRPCYDLGLWWVPGPLQKYRD